MLKHQGGLWKNPLSFLDSNEGKAAESKKLVAEDLQDRS